MTADFLKLSITTLFCLIPPEVAPAEDSGISRFVGAFAESLYFFACDLHTLFAIHRFILVVGHSARQRWSRLTPYAIGVCACTGVFKGFYLQFLDDNLYLAYDRKYMQWMWTDTPWTGFYRNSKIAWSSVENALIIILDTISYRKLRAMLKMYSNDSPIAPEYTNVDTRLVVQSLCQCVPTTLVIIFYFYIYPAMTNEFLMFATSTLMWNLATLCDGFIIVFFHTSPAIFRRGENTESAVGATTTAPGPQSPATLTTKL